MAPIPQAPRQSLSIHLASTGGGQPGPIPRVVQTLAVVLLLAGLLLLPAGCNRAAKTTATAPLPPTAPAGRLQEVAPPAAVQQLQAALADRDPRVSVELPADGATLPGSTWTLRLRVRDWPLVDAGALGLGAHVAVQIDDQPVLRLTEHRPTQAGDVVETSLPGLPPGSHRITVYAARPWGEAVKSPGASARIRVQAVAGNPLAVPAPGTPELVSVSPAEWSTAEPVLLDWLLYDAPLQHLREGDGSWRLRVSVNGDSFLVDQNVPLWLRGWKSGSNALQLELVDGRGEPMNPPFNSLVREVNLAGGPTPRWLGGPLKPEELAALLGEAPPPATEEAPPEEQFLDIPAAPAAGNEPAPANEEEEEAKKEERLSLSEPTANQASENPATAEPATQITAEQTTADRESEPENEVSQDGSSQAELPETKTAPEPAAAEPAGDQAPGDDQVAVAATAAPIDGKPEAAGTETQAPEPVATDAQAGPTDPPAPRPIPNPERVAPSTSLGGSAREQVAADGTLIQPTPRGPLAGLRQRLGAS